MAARGSRGKYYLHPELRKESGWERVCETTIRFWLQWNTKAQATKKFLQLFREVEAIEKLGKCRPSGSSGWDARGRKLWAS